MAYFALERAGTHLLQIAGTGAGGYALDVQVAGDVNGDHRVDGADELALGAASPLERQLLASNFGFAANLPPVTSDASARTHTDLPVRIDIGNLTIDSEDDLVLFAPINPAHGTVKLTADGNAVIFTPEPGYSGPASFEIVSDDGYNSGPAATVSITVSNAALLSLDFVNRNPRLEIGKSEKLTVVGNFQDQQNVLLDPAYLAFASTDPAVEIDATGRFVAKAGGSGALIASRGNISAATAFAVGNVDTLQGQAIQYLGLSVYPDALTLPGPGATRQFQVTLAGQIDIAPATQGTAYFAGNPAIVSVSPDGLLTALAPGQTSITITNSGSEQVIPVSVALPQTGPSLTLTANGGALTTPQGITFNFAPGAVPEDRAITVTPLATADFTVPLPDYFTFVQGFRLDTGGSDLAFPAQLVLPAPASLAAGTIVMIMREGAVPTPGGGTRTVYFQDEIATVGSDGFIRTQSDPYEGLEKGGNYVIAAGTDRVTVIRGKITATLNENLQSVTTIADNVLAFVSSLFTPQIVTERTIASVSFIATPRVGLPTFSSAGVELDPNGVPTFAGIVSPPPINTSAPAITGIDFFFQAGHPVVELRGVRLLDGAGSAASTEVLFTVGNQTPVPGVIILSTRSGGADVLHVRVPRGAVLGISNITVELSVVPNGSAVPIILKSNSVHLDPSGSLIFGAMRSDDMVAAMRGDTRQLVARIPVGDSPRSTAVTHDNARVYVTTANGVSLVDAMTLSEVDIDFTTAPIDAIAIPVSLRPFMVVVDPFDHFAYLTDENLPAVYVLDIRPTSPTYHQVVHVLSVSPADAPAGLRALALTPDGRRLFVTGPRKIFVFNVDSADESFGIARRYRQIIGALDAGAEPLSILHTNRPDTLVVTDRRNDTQAVGIITITNNDPLGFSTAPLRYIPARLTGPGALDHDYFDVNNAQAIVFSPDYQYAFVAMYNTFIAGVIDHDPNAGFPAGGNVGIIADPLGANPRFVAATRPIPVSFLDNLAVSSDGNHLFAAYRALPFSNPDPNGGGSALKENGAVFVFDINEIRQTLQAASGDAELAKQLLNTPIDDINRDIDINADYIIVEQHPAQGQYVFGVGDPLKAPIFTGGFIQGLSAQSDWLKLIGPLGGGNDKLPLFQWSYSGQQVVTARLYVSALPPGAGLLPTDRPISIPDPTLTQLGYSEQEQRDLLLYSLSQDSNPNRILTQSFLSGNITQFQLGLERQLTQGQTYYWAVQAFTADGRSQIKTGSFKTRVPAAATGFTQVTVINHGFQIPYKDLTIPEDYKSFARSIAASSDGLVFFYDKATGGWIADPVANPGATPAQALGRSLVLLTDWAIDSSISDSGFSEAASDAFLASLVDLDRALGGAVFTSPMHVLGFSRGTPVSSELVQRLGTYFPGIPRLQLTTLDPHDMNQPSLNVPLGPALAALTALGAPLGPFIQTLLGAAAGIATLSGNTVVQYGDFLDPDIYHWANAEFHDSYYQTNAKTAFLSPTFTPNGRSIPNADVDQSLNGYPAFSSDDITLGNTTLPFGVGLPHLRVKMWYIGTADLARATFPGLIGDDTIWRSRSQLTVFDYKGILRPWYRSGENEAGMPWPTQVALPPTFFGSDTDTAPWEGIGNGWFYTILGGGDNRRPVSSQPRTPVTFDNTETPRRTGDPVPTVFNGDFDSSIRPQFGRFPIGPSWKEIPGWSFHGGTGGLLQGDNIVSIVEAGNLFNAFPNLASNIDSLISKVISVGGKLLGASTAQVKLVQLPNNILSLFGISIGQFLANQLQGLDTLRAQGKVNNAFELRAEQLLDLAATQTLTHNRFFASGDTSVLSFSYAVTEAGVNDRLDVLLNGQVVHTIAIQDVTNGFVRVNVPISIAAQGEVITIGFHARDDVGLTLNAKVLIDDVTTASVIITDSSGDTSDGLVYYSEFDPNQSPNPPSSPGGRIVSAPDPANPQTVAAPPVPGEIVPGDVTVQVDNPFVDVTPAAFLGRDIHEITLTNINNKAYRIVIVVDANEFIVWHHLGNEIPAYTTTPMQLSSNIVLSPGTVNNPTTVTFRFESRLQPGFLAGQTVDENFLLHSVLHFYLVPLSAPVSPGQTVFNGIRSQDEHLFYFVDGADNDVNDNTLRFADTLAGRSRTIHIENNGNAGFSLEGSAFAPGPGTITLNGSNLVLNSTPVTTPGDVLDRLVFSFNGKPLNANDPIDIAARIMPPQVFQFPFQALADKFAEVSRDASFNDPIFNTFRSLFPDPVPGSNAELQFNVSFSFFTDALKDAFISILSPARNFTPDKLRIIDSGTDSSQVSLIYASSLPADQRKIAAYVPPEKLGFAFTSFNNLLFEGTGNSRTVQADLSPAQKRYRMDSVINASQFQEFVYVIDNMIRDFAFVPAAQRNAVGLGKQFGIVFAHEFAHNFGLLDEYVPGTGTLFGRNFMSSFFNDTVMSQHELAFRLAFNDPASNLSLTSGDVDALISFYNLTDQNDARLRKPRGTSFVSNPQAPGSATPADILPPVSAAVPGIANADFAISDPSNPAFAWTLTGGVVQNGRATLAESGAKISRLAQTFTIPDNASALRVKLSSIRLFADPLTAPDAFEIALLNASSLLSIHGPLPGLSGSDALFNLQPGGKYFAASGVTPRNLLPGNIAGDTITLDIDLSASALPPGTSVALFFDLLGSGLENAAVTIEAIEFISTAASNVPPTIDSVAISANKAGTDAVLTAVVTAHDYESDPISFDFQWYRNGVTIPGQVAATLDLSGLAGIQSGDRFSVRVTPIDGMEHIHPPFDGDVNNDGRIDAFDLNLLATHWQLASAVTRAMGDLTGDGIIDAADRDLVYLHWRAGISVSSADLVIELPNIPPPIDAIAIVSTDPAMLEAQLTAHDPEGDAITYDIQWLRNGTPIPGQNAPSLDLAVLSPAPVSDVIDLRVTPLDGQNHITPPFDGDVNNDGRVDAFDLNLIAVHWQAAPASRSQGDMTGDAQVNNDDLALVTAHWQAGATAFAGLRLNVLISPQVSDTLISPVDQPRNS